MPGDKKRDGPSATKRPPQVVPPGTEVMVSHRLDARPRVEAMERHRRICRELEHLASLAQYYGPRKPRPIPLGQFLVERWWAA